MLMEFLGGWSVGLDPGSRNLDCGTRIIMNRLGIYSSIETGT